MRNIEQDRSSPKKKKKKNGYHSKMNGKRSCLVWFQNSPTYKIRMKMTTFLMNTIDEPRISQRVLSRHTLPRMCCTLQAIHLHSYEPLWSVCVCLITLAQTISVCMSFVRLLGPKMISVFFKDIATLTHWKSNQGFATLWWSFQSFLHFFFS